MLAVRAIFTAPTIWRELADANVAALAVVCGLRSRITANACRSVSAVEIAIVNGTARLTGAAIDGRSVPGVALRTAFAVDRMVSIASFVAGYASRPIRVRVRARLTRRARHAVRAV